MRIEQYTDYTRTDLENTADDILRYEHKSTSDPVEIAFYIHHYLYREVEYDDRHEANRSIRGPQDCLSYGGNCEEQCVLLASLLESKGIPTQFVNLMKEDVAHLSCRCRITHGDSKAAEQIVDLCESTPTIDDYQKAISIVDSKNGGLLSANQKQRWYFADPVMGTYLGDPSGLRDTGYITKSGFEWKCDIRGYDPWDDRLLSG